MPASRLVLNTATAVDLVILTIKDGELVVLLIRRGAAPYRGRSALPGGFVLLGEDLAAAANRELAEETGLRAGVHLEQLATFGSPGRDPRGRVISVAYLALVADLPDPVAGTDAASASWMTVDQALGRPLAFDHRLILSTGVERARSKLEYTSLATSFCPPEFTIAELRRVYEAVWATPLDARNFHRKVSGADGFLVPVDRTTTRDGGRPAQLYRAGGADLLSPPMLRQRAR